MLPWEDDAQAHKLVKLRRLKGTILACLSRDPSMRPTAKDLVNAWERFFDVTETGPDLLGAKH